MTMDDGIEWITEASACLIHSRPESVVVTLMRKRGSHPSVPPTDPRDVTGRNQMVWGWEATISSTTYRTFERTREEAIKELVEVVKVDLVKRKKDSQESLTTATELLSRF